MKYIQILAGSDRAVRGFALRRANSIGAAGASIILLSAGAAMLPWLGPVQGTLAIGILLLIAGGVEILAGTMRQETKSLAMLAGFSTTVAGSLFLLNWDGRLLTSVTIITAWLLARAVILSLTSRFAHGSVRVWLLLSAATDLGLGLALLAGLSIMAFVITLFGAAPHVVASFAWILALSFVATGSLLLEVAGCERGGALGVLIVRS